MVSVEAEIDETAFNGLQALLTRIATLTPKKVNSETRHAAVLICRSLRARTRQAPKRIKRGEYVAAPSELPPRYAHSHSEGKALLRRWRLTRKLGTADENTHHYFVYTSAHRKKGKMVGKNAAAEKRELIREHGGIPRAGLAKKSWGWIAKQIYKMVGLGDIAYRPRRGERRDPRRAVNGVYHAFKTSSVAVLENKLDYIMSALQPGALEESVAAATKNLERSVEAALVAAENRAAPPASSSTEKFWRAYAKAKGRELR